MDTLEDLTPAQNAALVALNEAAGESEPAEWWRRQWQIDAAGGGYSRTVLDALIRRNLIVHRLEGGTHEWKITQKGRRLFAAAVVEE